MPKLILASETVGCGADILLDSGEACLVSVAQTGVMVRSYRPGFFGRMWGTFNGPTLYNERNVYLVAKTAIVLTERFPQRHPELTFTNPVLAAFANAIWLCEDAGQVSVALNDAGAAAKAQE